MKNLVMRGGSLVLFASLAVAGAWAQWDPANGQWGKTEATDIRVMTWNVQDGICRTADKSEGTNSWCALARIIASMKPDVLILQETGDNQGNGTGTGVDSVAFLNTTLGLFLHGGTDPFMGGTVGAYVQKYAATYDLPNFYVSTVTDGYNRNVILSRLPFGDVNGDGAYLKSDISIVLTDEYAPGGTGGIRGFMFVEFNLPDATYEGDLVVGNAHLKSGSASGDLSDRLIASQNVAYYMDYLYNGAGTGTPDPHSKINDSPAATRILDADTPIVIGGDWNEDELTNGRRGPADWLTQAQTLGGTDGVDQDRSDMTYDSSLVAKPSGPDERSTEGSAKFDYIAWQDSVATLRRSFIFRSINLTSSWYPPEIVGFNPTTSISTVAADHRPVIADLIVPLVPTRPCSIPGDANCDGAVNNQDIDGFVLALFDQAGWLAEFPCDYVCSNDVNGDDAVNNQDIDSFVAVLFGP